MGREYKITTKPLQGESLLHMLQCLPPPLQKPQTWEIYGVSVEEDGYYFIDHLVDRYVAARAFMILVDAALATQDPVTISEL